MTDTTLAPARPAGATAETAADAPILSVRDLSVSFRSSNGWSNVLRGLSFDVPRGKTVALVGESGSGKSVTSLALMRLLPKGAARVEGRMTFEGRDLGAMADEDIRALRGQGISMIFQEPMTSLNPVMTLGQQVTEAIVAHGTPPGADARAEALALLERVRIPDAKRRFNDYPHQFSGGMRQRVMIAMALAGKPRLLIADEPTTALDVTVQAQIIDLLRELQRDTGLSILFITHDMGVVAEMADEMVVMYRGDMIETGPTLQVFEAPRAPYTLSLLSAVPRLGSMTVPTGPQRFPLIDPATGQVSEARAVVDTVQPDQTVLDVRNLVTQFDIQGGVIGRVKARVHAVEDVSFDLRAGETLSLVGESGCGKSTLGRSVLQLLNTRKGTVEIDGKVIGTDKASRRQLRRDAQMIFQDPFASLNPRISVGRSIAEPMVVHGIEPPEGREARVRDLLSRVGLDPAVAERFPHEFSGGQRQRICIARALTLDPKLIIADEAVSALDVSVKAQIVNLLLDLQEQMGIAFLFISHDMAVVERVSHRIAVMYLGQIVEIGPRHSIMAAPQHPYTQRLISAVPIPDPQTRNRRAPVPLQEVPSPIRGLDYEPPVQSWRAVGPDHFVRLDS